MSSFFADPSPIGVNPPDNSDRRAIHKLVGGDALVIHSKITLIDGETPVVPDNSILHFVLTNQRFSTCHEWEGFWFAGIEETGEEPGRIVITIPDTVTCSLRRGSYLYSLRVSDTLGGNRYTALKGSILVEYEPTSPHHDIPYKPEG